MISRCPKSEATVEMMPLTCAQALGRQRPATATGVVNPDDWLPRACAWRPLPRWRVVVADWQQPAGEEEETFLWTHPFDPGRLAMMPAIMPRSEPGPRCVFQPAGQVPWFPVLGLVGKGFGIGKGLTSCRYFTSILRPVKLIIMG